MEQKGTNWALKRMAVDSKGVATRYDHTVLRHALKTFLGFRETIEAVSSILEDVSSKADLGDDAKQSLSSVQSALTKEAESARNASVILNFVFSHNFETAAKFLQTDVDDDMTPEEAKRLERVVKLMDKPKQVPSSSGGPPAKKPFRNKANDTCRACQAVGHWASDAICPLNKQSSGTSQVPTIDMSSGQAQQFTQHPNQYSIEYSGNQNSGSQY